MQWRITNRVIDLDRPAVMGILNVTPDSFSDAGRFAGLDAAVARAEQMIAEGADVIDVGGESTRPGSERIHAAVEVQRVVPVVAAIAKRFDVPVSIDTTRAEVARAAVEAGASIINDISGLRFEPAIADAAAEFGTGLILMHSRGDFATMHSQVPVGDIFEDVRTDLERAINRSRSAGLDDAQIVLDIGLGFGKTFDQNLELIAGLERIGSAFPQFPILVGASRKSFVGRILGKDDPKERLYGSVATAAIAVIKGAKLVRAHDVKATVDAVRVAEAILRRS